MLSCVVNVLSFFLIFLIKKANGFYSRFLDTAIGKLNLSVPRDRNSKFRPQIIPDKYVRDDESYSNLLQSFIINGYPDSSLRNTLKALGLSYSQSDLDHIVKSLKEELMLFKTIYLNKFLLFSSMLIIA